MDRRTGSKRAVILKKNCPSEITWAFYEVSHDLKGPCPAICYHLKKLKRVFSSTEFQK